MFIQSNFELLQQERNNMDMKLTKYNNRYASDLHSQQPPPEGGDLKSRRIPIILTQWIFTARFRPCDQVSMSFHRCCGRHSGSEEIGFMRDIIPTIQHYVCL